GSEANGEVRDRAEEASNDSLTSDTSEKSALDKYALRVKRAAAQYRRECAGLANVGGLPLGVQIVTAPWREDLALRVAAAAEALGAVAATPLKPPVIR